jgi:type VI secretion system protein VasI
MPVLLNVMAALSFAIALTGPSLAQAIESQCSTDRCQDPAYAAALESLKDTLGNPWSVSIQKSRMDDSDEVLVFTQSSQSIPSPGGLEQRAILTFKCAGNTTLAAIWFGGLFMADTQGYGAVSYRVDAKKAVTGAFSVSNDHEHLGLWSGSRSIPFAKSLFGGKSLVVQAAPFSANLVTLDFDIAGLEETMIPLRKACTW